jgi:hypothetical protein
VNVKDMDVEMMREDARAEQVIIAILSAFFARV